MCGIFGASLNPKLMDRGMTKAAIAKFKMLGVYNTERGRHSCGIFMGDIISKGVDVDKEFYNYIAAHDLPDPMISGNFTMIGHTRMATHGSHTAANAHPFIVEDDFVLAHNGVIRNVWTLCNKYGISHTNIHVDSLGLAHLINQEGFKVLNEYEGFAALLMARRSEPNSLYVYRGVSKRYATGLEEEERPLFYLQSEEGIYFSSLEKSLLAISDAPGDRVKTLEGNVVHKITNGHMTKVKFNVQRDTINYGVNANTYGGSAAQNYPKPPGTGTPQKTIGQTTSSSATDITPTNTTGTNCRVGGIHGNAIYPPSSQMSSQVFDKIVPVIWHETLPKRVDRYAGKKGIIYHVGRYWIVENDEIKIANGSYYINKKGIISSYKLPTAHNYYFYMGVMMKSFNAFNVALADSDLKNIFWNFAMFISKYCNYPVCNSMEDISTGCKDVSDFLKYRWYKDGALCGNTGFTPMYCDRNYIIRDGLLHSISTQKGTAQEPCIDVEGMKNARAAVLRPLPSTHPFVSKVNDELPFPAPEPTIHVELPKEKTPPEWDVTHFYQPFTSVEEARTTFTKLEVRALGYYIADIMATEMGIFPDNVNDDQVDVQLNMMLQMCVENGVSVHDNWDDKNYKDILDYLLIADENPEGIYVEEAMIDDNEAPVEACEFVPKPPANVIEMVAQITESINDGHMEVVVNNLRKPTEDKLYMKEFPSNFGDGIDGAGDPLPIDQIVAREMARVPKREDDPEGPLYTEAYTKEDERDFAFQDIVDNMVASRECADELGNHQDSDFAQETASIVYKVIDPLLRDLRDLALKHGEVDLDRYVKEVLSKKVTTK